MPGLLRRASRTGVWTVGLAGALLLGTGCKQGLGERCQISDDCSGDLVCSIATKTCETSQNGPTTDGATPDVRVTDASQAVIDGGADAPVVTPDAALDATVPPADASIDAT